MLTQSKRVTRIGNVIIWLAHIILVAAILTNINNVWAGVIKKREIPSYPQKEITESFALNIPSINSTQKESIGGNQMKVNELQQVVQNSSEHNLREMHENDSATLVEALPSKNKHESKFSFNNETTRQDLSVTELNYNDINGRAQGDRYLRPQNVEKDVTAQSKEALKVFDNDILQILGTIESPLVTTIRPNSASIEGGIVSQNPNDISTTLSNLDTQQTDQATTEISIKNSIITQNPISTTHKPSNPVQDKIVDIDSLKDSELNNVVITDTPLSKFKAEITGKLNASTSLLTEDNLDETFIGSPKNETLQNRKNRKYETRNTPLEMHEKFTLGISENEIITTTPLAAKSNSEYITNKRKFFEEKTSLSADDSNVKRTDKYIDNNITISTQQVNSPRPDDIWTLARVKLRPQLNATIETAHEQQSAGANTTGILHTPLSSHNSEKALLDWSQIMSTNELMDNKNAKVAAELKETTSSSIPTSITPITDIPVSKVSINEISTTINPTNNILGVEHNSEKLSQSNDTLSIVVQSSTASAIKTNLSVSEIDNTRDDSTTPTVLQNSTEYFVEVNTEMNIEMPTMTTLTSHLEEETDIEIEKETEAALSESTAISMTLINKNETTNNPPSIFTEIEVKPNKTEKAGQDSQDEQYFANDANTTASIADDAAAAVAVTTTSTNIHSLTLEPNVSEATTFSTLITDEPNVTESPPVFIVNTTQKNTLLDNHNNITEGKTNIAILNKTAPSRSSIHNVNIDDKESTTDIGHYNNETKLEKVKANQTHNSFVNSIETATSLNTFNSTTHESHLINQDGGETTTETTETTETTIEAITVNSEESVTLRTVTGTESKPTTESIIHVTVSGSESTTTFSDTNINHIINQESDEKNEEENENNEITTAYVSTPSEIDIGPVTATTFASATGTETTTGTGITPVDSSNIGHSSESSIETNIIDEINVNKSENVNIENTIIHTRPTSTMLTKSEDITESNVIINDNNENVFTTIDTTMGDVVGIESTTMEIITDSTLNSSFMSTSTMAPTSDSGTQTIPTKLVTKMQHIYNVIHSTTTEYSIQEVTTVSSPPISSTKQDATTESSTISNIINPILNETSTTTMTSSTSVIYHSDSNRSESRNIFGHNHGIMNVNVNREITDGRNVALPTLKPSLKTIENDDHHLFQPETSETNGETDVNVIIAIIVSVIGIVALILLVAFLYLIRKRQKSSSYSQRCRPVSLDDYTIDSTSIYNSIRFKSANANRTSKRSHANLAFDDPSLRHNILDVTGLGKFVQDKCSIYEEFRDVPQVTARADEVPPGCEDKNRYANIVPLPETRVMLQRLNDDAKTEYINANYVRGPKDAAKYYIACQAPLDSTIEDFWRMIWEQKSRVIIQATDLVENGVEKCAEYLPPSMTLDNHTTFGDFQVTLHHREVKEKYATSIILLKHLGENVTRELTHYWYKWPEVGVPMEEAPIIAMLLEARSSLISYAIEYANQTKEDSSAFTLKSSEDNVTNNNANVQAKDKESTANNNGGEINGNISMVHIRKKTAKYQGPLTVHCSPGTGRTGTIISCDIAIRSLELPQRTVDIPQIVYYVRHGRASAVLTKEQYEFIYKVVNMYATKITSSSFDN